MNKTNLDDLLSKLHEEIAQNHLDVIMSGEATEKDREAARKFLADNGVSQINKAHKPLGALLKALPYGDPTLLQSEA